MTEKTNTGLIASGLFGEFDIQFAKFILRFSPDDDPDIFLAAAMVSHVTGMGDICLDLSMLSETGIVQNRDTRISVPCPALEPWIAKLAANPSVGRPGDTRPLILDSHNRLYLYRYWDYEQNLAGAIKQRTAAVVDDLNLSDLKVTLKRLFPDKDQKPIDWQLVAAVSAAFNNFCVITGGPGTGKTFTITRILALILELSQRVPLNIRLAAPTGKAAARLKESINASKKELDCSDAVKDAIPDHVATIHRLLNTIPGSPYFRHNSEKPLNADIILVDEASMVDLALMSKLVQAAPASARLILVGDRDQLASVEAGSVLGDICDRKTIHGFSKEFSHAFAEYTGESLSGVSPQAPVGKGLQDGIVILQKSYRFPEDSGIGGLSQAVKDGDSAAAIRFLSDVDDKSIEWIEPESSQDLYRMLSRKIVQGYSPYLKMDDPSSALKALNQFRMLCAVNAGNYGVNAINRLAEHVLSKQQLIHPSPKGENQWYRGRPVLITGNDYNLDLFNGDIGIMMPSAKTNDSELEAYFQGTDDEVRGISPYRLSAHETVYAMTVHKSQGSEFDEVLLILPDKDYPLLTRELIYTGLTRARKKVVVCGRKQILNQALKRRIVRTSGLRDTLWGPSTAS